MKRFIKAALCGICLTAAGIVSAASDYPTKPIQIVVPWAAGTGLDGLTRTLAAGMAQELDSAVVVENRVGAGGNIGSASVARAKPDGYTFVMGSNGPFAANKALYAELGFDPVEDFSPLVLIGKVPMLLIGNNDTESNTLDELLAEARDKPGVLNFGASNTTARIWVELLKLNTGIDVETVLYSNAGDLLTDLMSGRIDYSFENVGTSRPLLDASKIKGIAVTSEKRAAFAPDLPTVAESSLEDPNLVVWFAMFAPKDTAPDRLARINAVVNKQLKTPEMANAADLLGLSIVGGSPEALGSYQKDEVAKWQEMVTQTGIEIN